MRIFELISLIYEGVLKDEYLPFLFVFIFFVGALILINIVLGTITGAIKMEFNICKFLFGFVKGIIVASQIYAFAFIVSCITIALNMMKGFEIATELVTVGGIVAVVLTWCIDLTKEIFDKIQKLRDLKFISYEDIKFLPQGEVTGSDVIEEEDTGERLEPKEVG